MSDKVGKETIAMMKDVLVRTRTEYLVRGSWNVPETEKGSFGVMQIAL